MGSQSCSSQLHWYCCLHPLQLRLQSPSGFLCPQAPGCPPPPLLEEHCPGDSEQSHQYRCNSRPRWGRWEWPPCWPPPPYPGCSWPGTGTLRCHLSPRTGRRATRPGEWGVCGESSWCPAGVRPCTRRSAALRSPVCRRGTRGTPSPGTWTGGTPGWGRRRWWRWGVRRVRGALPCLFDWRTNWLLSGLGRAAGRTHWDGHTQTVHCLVSAASQIIHNTSTGVIFSISGVTLAPAHHNSQT